jgi:hypothetical protein
MSLWRNTVDWVAATLTSGIRFFAERFFQALGKEGFTES